MKTVLYKSVRSGMLLTLDEIRDEYIFEHDCDLPISRAEMELIILNDLVRKEKSIQIVNDKVLDWCNSYAEYKEASRYLSLEERDESVLHMYTYIISAVEKSIDWKAAERVILQEADLFHNGYLYLKLIGILKEAFKK